MLSRKAKEAIKTGLSQALSLSSGGQVVHRHASPGAAHTGARGRAAVLRSYLVIDRADHDATLIGTRGNLIDNEECF
jgi:hypothetical protein